MKQVHLASSVEDLLAKGAHVDLSQTTTKFLASQLEDFARLAARNGGSITISSKGLLYSAMKDIAIAGNGKHVHIMLVD